MLLMPRRDFNLFDDDFFHDDFFGSRERNTFNLMKTDIKETEHSYLLDVDLPGYDKKDIKIDITDGYLNIHANRNEEKEEKKDGKFLRRERFTGEVSRSFYVGEDVEMDEVKASFKNGILSLEVPKIDPEVKTSEKKYIEISD